MVLCSAHNRTEGHFISNGLINGLQFFDRLYLGIQSTVKVFHAEKVPSR